jgi:hypothetical protein
MASALPAQAAFSPPTDPLEQQSLSLEAIAALGF